MHFVSVSIQGHWPLIVHHVYDFYLVVITMITDSTREAVWN